VARKEALKTNDGRRLEWHSGGKVGRKGTEERLGMSGECKRQEKNKGR